jgi:protein-disulfide isomerase
MSPRVVWPLVFALVLAAALGGFFVARTTGSPRPAAAPPAGSTTPPATADPLLEARTKGSPDAPITVLEIADFQCPACRVFWAETMPLLQREYVEPGRVRFVFVNLPLVQIHPNAAAAHEFAMCAAAQGRFWPVHDMLFDQQAVWARLDDPSAYFFSVASATGLDADSVDACVTDGRMRPLIMQEAEGVVRAGVQSTPSFVIEGGLLAGAVPIEGWRPILDSIYEAKMQR